VRTEEEEVEEEEAFMAEVMNDDRQKTNFFLF